MGGCLRGAESGLLKLTRIDVCLYGEALGIFLLGELSLARGYSRVREIRGLK